MAIPIVSATQAMPRASASNPCDPGSFSQSSTGQCQRYTPYEISPSHATGLHENQRPGPPAPPTHIGAIIIIVKIDTATAPPRK